MPALARKLWWGSACHSDLSSGGPHGRIIAFDAASKACKLGNGERNSDGEVRGDPLSLMIVAVAQERDKDAFAGLFRHFAPRLKSYFMRGGGNPAAAEEIVQETMLTVWRRAETFDPNQSSAATWIFTIARNKRIDALRRERRYDPAVEPEDRDIDPDPTPSDMLELSQTYRQVSAHITELPGDQATVLKMAFLDDKSHASIAEELDLPLGTVKSRIRLGLDKMRSMMTEVSQ